MDSGHRLSACGNVNTICITICTSFTRESHLERCLQDLYKDSPLGYFGRGRELGLRHSPRMSHAEKKRLSLKLSSKQVGARDLVGKIKCFRGRRGE